MNIRLPGSFYLVSVVFLSGCPIAFAEEHGHSCPDMSQHERVLNEGSRMHKVHGTSRGWSGRLDLMTIPQFSTRDYTPSQREYDLRHSLNWLEDSVDSIPLTTYDKRHSAEQYAEQFEEIGSYTPARKLYERLLQYQQTSLNSDSYELSKLKRNIERVKLSRTADELMTKNRYSEAIDCLDKAAANIETSDFNLFTKVNLLKLVTSDINRAIKEQGAKPGLSPEAVLSSQKTKARVLALSNNWKRELECLGMAQSLDRTAWNLEQDGQYAMAEKLYKQALMIKQKNLGADAPETLAQNADFGRLCAERGHTAEACKYYEDGLKGLRKLPNPGRTYTTMLESYGDMLDRTNNKTLAEKIYEEARTYNAKVRAER